MLLHIILIRLVGCDAAASVRQNAAPCFCNKPQNITKNKINQIIEQVLVNQSLYTHTIASPAWMNTYIWGATNKRLTCVHLEFFFSKIDIEHLKCGRITRQNENFKKQIHQFYIVLWKKKNWKKADFWQKQQKKIQNNKLNVFKISADIRTDTTNVIEPYSKC